MLKYSQIIFILFVSIATNVFSNDLPFIIENTQIKPTNDNVKSDFQYFDLTLLNSGNYYLIEDTFIEEEIGNYHRINIVLKLNDNTELLAGQMIKESNDDTYRVNQYIKKVYVNEEPNLSTSSEPSKINKGNFIINKNVTARSENTYTPAFRAFYTSRDAKLFIEQLDKENIKSFIVEEIVRDPNPERNRIVPYNSNDELLILTPESFKDNQFRIKAKYENGSQINYLLR